MKAHNRPICFSRVKSIFSPRFPIFLGIGAAILLNGCEKPKAPPMAGSVQAPGVEVTEVKIQTTEIPASEAAQLVEHLQKAYAREYGASVKYEKWGEKAEKEGWKRAAALFRAISHSEKVHADNHAAALKVLGAAPIANIAVPEAGTLEEMFQNALENERETVENFYPELITGLKKLKNHETLLKNFESAKINDGQHAKLYESAVKDPKKWNDEGGDFTVCLICGEIMEGTPPANCPKCGSAKEKFKTFSGK
ncbi:MAG: rubrerythrin family protein [Planctomycetaceae bacterium]|nr:rubrerythrin family protein [Planctomycetaceae bacterium]